MKLLVSLNRKEVNDYLNYTNSFIIGLKDYSINYIEFTLDEIEKLLKDNPKIELFVSINKNIFNNELDGLEKSLILLNKLNIKGVLFYDLAVLAMVKRLNLNIPLVWHQTHMVTNYNTCNYYYSKGVEYAYIATEITLDEIIEIKKNTKIKLMALFLGHPIVSHSRRNLLTNYFKNYNRFMEKDTYKIKEANKEGSEYYIREKNHGTSILYGNILNGTKYLNKLQDTLEYAILDEQLIDHDLFIKLLKLVNEVINNNNEALKKINDLIGEDTLFFEKKTIYKVKKNEKN